MGLCNYATEGTLQAASRAAATVGSGMLPKSGRMPSLSMSVLAGVRYLPIVTASADPSSSWKTPCMSPLPNVLQESHQQPSLPDRLSSSDASRGNWLPSTFIAHICRSQQPPYLSKTASVAGGLSPCTLLTARVRIDGLSSWPAAMRLDKHPWITAGME